MALRDSETCVCDLAAFFGLNESAISDQLRLLRDQTLVKKKTGLADSLFFAG